MQPTGECPYCASVVPGDARFCHRCGAPLATIETVEQLLEREMLKTVTILFADVVGSTSRVETMTPDQTRALLTDFFAAMTEVVVREGGIVERLLGDALMADFGVPTAHEDDPLRAVRAATQMLEALGRWNETRTEDQRLQIRIGINTGEVSTAGAPGQGLMVLGDTVNVAARLEQVAVPGQVLIGERTARAVGTYFELAELEPLILKGKRSPVRAYRVVGAKPETPAERPYQTPLIGRDGERELLDTIYRRVVTSRRPQLVTIVGEPGVGKTRLVRDFTGSIAGTAQILTGRCLPYGKGVTLWPLSEILRAEAGLAQGDAPALVREKLAKLVAGYHDGPAGEIDAVSSSLASTLGIEVGSSGPARPFDDARALTDGWVGFMNAMTSRSPVVLVIEDADWADETLFEILDELVSKVTGPLLLLCPQRPGGAVRPPGSERTHAVLPVEPLAPHEVRLMIMAMLEAGELPPRLAELIVRRSGGNPFFLEEIVAGLVDDGTLVREGSSVKVARKVTSLAIPETVHAVLLARLDLLPHEPKRALQLASVVGQQFWAGAVAHLGGFSHPETLLAELARRGFVEQLSRSSVAGETAYAFRHGLIRDVAYDTLPRSERGQAHLLAAGWIEDIAMDRVSELVELIAHHYENAWAMLQRDDLRVTARAKLLHAAHAATARFALQQGRDLAGRALALSHAPVEKVEAWEAMADMMALSFHGVDAWEAYRSALVEAEGSGSDGVTIGRLAAKAATIPTRLITTMVRDRIVTREAVESLIDKGLGALGDSNSADRVTLLLSRSFLTSAQFLGDLELDPEERGVALAREALELAERLDDPQLLSTSLDALSSQLKKAGRYGEAGSVDGSRLELVTRLTDVSEICDAFSSAAWTASFLGRYEEAYRFATGCIEHARDVDPGNYQAGLVWRIYARFRAGDWAGALTDLTELETVGGSAVRELPFAQAAFATAALCAELRGMPDEAEKYIGIVMVVRRKLAQTGASPTFHASPLALALLHRGQPGDAWAVLDGRPSSVRPVNLAAQCEVVPALGDSELALSVLADTRAAAELGGIDVLTAYGDRLEAVLRAPGDPEGAAEGFVASARGFDRLTAVWDAAYSRLLAGESYLEAGRDDLGRPIVAKALEVFTTLGSQTEQLRAQRALAT